MEKTFAEGVYFDKPKQGRPDFIKGELSILVEKLVPFIQKHKNERGWVKLDLLKSKDGTKFYFQLNDFQPKKAEQSPEDKFEEELNKIF